jgi:hypothetical protein
VEKGLTQKLKEPLAEKIIKNNKSMAGAYLGHCRRPWWWRCRCHYGAAVLVLVLVLVEVRVVALVVVVPLLPLLWWCG